MNQELREPVRKREIFGWAMFDFANSSFTTVMISVMYSTFFVSAIVPEGRASDTWWGVAIQLSVVLTLVLSPLFGALCDISGHKLRYLAVTASLCVLSCLALYFVQPGDLYLAVLLVALANLGYNVSETFSSSLLPDLASEDDMAKISGIGWGLGYFGGLTSLAVAMFVLAPISTASIDAARFVLVEGGGLFPSFACGGLNELLVEREAEWLKQQRLVPVFCGLFFLVSSLPTFLLVKERSKPRVGNDGAWLPLVVEGYRRFIQSFALLKDNRTLRRFLFAFMVYMAGLDAVIKFVGIYATKEVMLNAGEMTMLFLAIQVSAAAGAIGFGYLENRLGSRRTLVATLIWWCVGVVLIMAGNILAPLVGLSEAHYFIITGLLTGTGIGSLQSSSRAVVGTLAPKENTAQVYGFWTFFARLGTILGMTYAFAADGLGSRRLALGLLLIFFVVGAFLLPELPHKGERDAR